MVPFLISMMMMIFQQWSGVNVVIYYTVTIFSAAQIAIDAHLASNIVGLVQLLATASNYTYYIIPIYKFEFCVFACGLQRS
jgi:hypothetical protein